MGLCSRNDTNKVVFSEKDPNLPGHKFEFYRMMEVKVQFLSLTLTLPLFPTLS